MISALVIARVLTEVGVASRFVSRRPKITGLATTGRVRDWLNRKNPDLMVRRKLWLGLSGAALVAALVGIFGAGLNLGLEFTGGRVVDYTTNQPVSADKAREIVADVGVPEAVVQESTQPGQGPVITVRAGEISDEERDAIQEGLAAEAGGAERLADNEIAASLGTELRNKALLAFGIALAAQMIYLAFRFKWTFGVAAVLTMFHDVVIVTGIFAWLGKPIDGIFLAAALTIIGLSVNDTVVVFDRIRERWHGTKSTDFAAVSNKAAVETMPRTVNTGLGAMFILAALAVLGGASLRDFSIALLLGLLIGTYSSVFTATPLLTYLQQKWPLDKAKKTKKVRDPEDSGAVV
jgi:SecD/SecF fusion protein